MVNGYVTLDLASNNIYKGALGAIKSGKPVMVVDAPNVYFADTIKTATIDDDVVVEITKGGKTITINDANAVSSVGDFVNHLYQYYLKLVASGLEDVMFKFYSSQDLTITMDNVVEIYENYIANDKSQNQVQLSGYDDNGSAIITAGYLEQNDENVDLTYYGAKYDDNTLASYDNTITITSIGVNKLQIF